MRNETDNIIVDEENDILPVGKCLIKLKKKKIVVKADKPKLIIDPDDEPENVVIVANAIASVENIQLVMSESPPQVAQEILNTNIPLQIKDLKRPSSLDGICFLESIDLNRTKALIQSGFLKTTAGRGNVDYPNDETQLTDYLANYDEKLGGVPVKYFKAKHKVGRVFPSKSLGLTAFRRTNRNTIVMNDWYDIDLKNAHFEIVRNLCLAYNAVYPQNPLTFDRIKHYCVNRKTIIKETTDEYTADPIAVKELFISLLNKGSFGGWCNDNNLGGNLYPTEFIAGLVSEVNNISAAFKRLNTELYDIAKHSKEGKSLKDNDRTFFALFLQEWECRIIECALQHLIPSGVLGKGKVKECSYEFDGFKLKKMYVDVYNGGAAKLVMDANEIVRNQLGFDLEFVVKGYDEFYDISAALAIVEEENQADMTLYETCDYITSKFDNTGVIEVIQTIKKDHFIYSTMEKSFFCWDEEQNRWVKNEYPLRKAIIYKVFEYLNGLLMVFSVKFDTDDEKPDAMLNPNEKIYRKTTAALAKFHKEHLRDNTQGSKCVGQAKALLINDKIKFDMNPHLFGCDNGVLDIEAEIFRPYKFKDYMTMSCGWDYKPIPDDLFDENADANYVADEVKWRQQERENVNEVIRVFEMIFPDPEVRDCMLTIYASGISGLLIEKFFIFNGKGRNGKGLLTEFNEVVLGQYFYYGNVLVLTENSDKAGSGAGNPEIANMDKKRMVVWREPKKNVTLCSATIKGITGGGKLKARKLYCNENDVNACLTGIMETNKVPNLDEPPINADKERIVDCGFPSSFTDDETLWDSTRLAQHLELGKDETTFVPNYVYPLDPTLKDDKWRNQHKNAWLNILFKQVIKLKKEKYIINKFIPACVMVRTEAYLQGNEPVHKVFLELFELGRKDQKYMCCDFKTEVIYTEPSAKEDWSVSQVVKYVRESQNFLTNPNVKKDPKDFTATLVKQFFSENKFYQGHIKKRKNGSSYFVNWRLKPTFMDDGIIPVYAAAVEVEEYEEI